MGAYDSAEAEAKNQSIEIWLKHLKVSRNLFFFVSQLMPPSSTTKSAAKSSAKSSRSSLQSAASASSLSKAVRSSAKVIGRGVKRIKKGASAIARPLKRAKHALSNVSSPVDSEAEHSLASDRDQDSLNTADLPEVFEVDSDGDEVNDLEKELGTSTCFSLFIILLISNLSGSKENLAVPDIFLLQTRRHYRGTRWPCRPFLRVFCEEMLDGSERHSTLSRQGRQILNCQPPASCIALLWRG